jgi:hypothetical protein
MGAETSREKLKGYGEMDCLTSDLRDLRFRDSAAREFGRGAQIELFIAGRDSGRTIAESALNELVDWCDVVVPGVQRRDAFLGRNERGCYLCRVRVDKETDETLDEMLKGVHGILKKIADGTPLVGLGKFDGVTASVIVSADDGMERTYYNGETVNSYTCCGGLRHPYLEMKIQDVHGEAMLVEAVKAVELAFHIVINEGKYEDPDAIFRK